MRDSPPLYLPLTPLPVRPFLRIQYLLYELVPHRIPLMEAPTQKKTICIADNESDG